MRDYKTVVSIGKKQWDGYLISSIVFIYGSLLEQPHLSYVNYKLKLYQPFIYILPNDNTIVASTRIGKMALFCATSSIDRTISHLPHTYYIHFTDSLSQCVNRVYHRTRLPWIRGYCQSCYIFTHL